MLEHDGAQPILLIAIIPLALHTCALPHPNYPLDVLISSVIANRSRVSKNRSPMDIRSEYLSGAAKLWRLVHVELGIGCLLPAESPPDIDSC